ncbi:MAG: TauD/TfdA family dioxygenase [Gammaproteobacteria bacterium]|nr:TauD/TfdA family dioxygenase [Gammaproteobacteria bacterium]
METFAGGDHHPHREDLAAAFGNGCEIDVSDLLHIRATARACEVVFPWRTGDVMVIDNVIAMHGRKPFSGERTILVAMA